MNITYTQNGDYLIPNIVIRKTKPIGHYGRLRKAYLEMHRPILFNELVLSDKLFEHCAEIDEAARNRMELIVRSLAEQNGVTEQLKADNQMEWVRQMNASAAYRAGERLYSECEKADDVYGGRLPVHVRCLIDEMANIGQIPNLEKLVATIRSREISACLVLQAQSQLKAIYKDNADTIIGNMDSRIFLGGSEPTTLKELNQALGKETIDTYNTSNTRGNSPSYGLNYQKLGKDLASVDELAVLDGSKCILQLRGVRPFLSDKYDLTQHPNYKYTSDFDKRNEFNIEQFLSRRLKLKAGDEFVVVDAD